MADTVAENYLYICACMSSQHETLVTYVEHFGKVKGYISWVTMYSIDSNGMDLGYRIEDSPGKAQVLRIEFDPPLRSYKEAGQRLRRMRADAEEALHPLERIQITHFEVPREIRTNASFLLLLIYTMGMPAHSTFYFWLPARILRYIFPNVLFHAVWVFACVAGVLEGVYAAYLAHKHHMPWHIALAWVSLATIFGMPVLTRLHNVIVDAQWESMLEGLGH